MLHSHTLFTWSIWYLFCLVSKPKVVHFLLSWTEKKHCSSKWTSQECQYTKRLKPPLDLFIKLEGYMINGKNKITFKHDHIQVISTWYLHIFWISLLWNFKNHVFKTNPSLKSPSSVNPPPFARWARSPSSAPKTLERAIRGGWFYSPMAYLEIYWWYIHLEMVWFVTSTFWRIWLHMYRHRCVYWKHISYHTHALMHV